MKRVRWKALLAACATLAVAGVALARVGGGESYSGGGGSGGGDGSTGAAIELVFYIVRFLFWLTFRYPIIGIPTDIVVIYVVVKVVHMYRSASATPNTLLRVTTSGTASAPSRASLSRLPQLQKFDPNFSQITFSDFCYSLYGRAHHARGAGDLDRYAPYLSAAARGALRAQNPPGLTEVRGVVIGSFRIADFRGLDGPQLIAIVAFEANYTEVVARGTSGNAGKVEGTQSWYVQEEWMLERRRDILSPPPEKAKADHCPRCGAPLETRADGACNYCGVAITNGSFQWFVRSVSLKRREARGPLLTSNVPEQGTWLPTVRQTGLAEQRAAFESAHSDFRWDAFDVRVRSIATTLQEAWSARDWERVRPLETEPLFQMHRYWIDAYVAQRLRNAVDNYRVTNVEPVKIAADAFYESITVRVWAEGADYTTDESNRVVAGSRDSVRRWSEYWTLIRTRSSAGSKSNCPNCGAAVEVGATGVCPYCGGKITAATFDWILSRIEQDEAYSG